MSEKMKMWTISLLLLVLDLFVADGIRLLKDGPMIDSEGREYKSLRVDEDKGAELEDEATVRVVCTESLMIVSVKPDVYKTGHRVSADELFLGEVDHSQSAQCRFEAAENSEFIIKAGLQDCGSTLEITEDSLIYSNKLIISPAVRYYSITRTIPAVIPVACHYKRNHVVSSHQPLPTPPPDFSLTLMNDDWTQETPSRVFHLGDMVHLQAAYRGPDSARRRLLVDGCVATLSPDVTSVPRYHFIENHGCLTDATDERARTRFRPRARADSLQLQMDVFLFHQDSRNTIFLTCDLRATLDLWRSSSTNKVCDYKNSRWKNIDGHDDVCRCCDSSCDTSFPKWSGGTNLRSSMSKDITGCVTLGPLMVFLMK